MPCSPATRSASAARSGNYATFADATQTTTGSVVGNGWWITSTGTFIGTFGSPALLPTAAQVQSGVGFGVGQTGIYDPLAAAVSPPANKRLTTATYGPTGAEYTGTVDIANATAGNIKSGVTIAGVAGTYDPLAAAVPPANKALTTATYGPTGAEYTGTVDITNATAGNIKSGVTIAGVAGTYDPLAAAVFPPTNQALTTATYGPTGAGIHRHGGHHQRDRGKHQERGDDRRRRGDLQSDGRGRLPADEPGTDDGHLRSDRPEYTGTVDITNATAGNIKSGVTIAGCWERTDPVTGNYTDPGIDCVESGHTYKFNGVTLTGTYDYAMPDPSVVKSGFTMADGTVGDYDPVSGNYSDPGSAWVAARLHVPLRRTSQGRDLRRPQPGQFTNHHFDDRSHQYGSHFAEHFRLSRRRRTLGHHFRRRRRPDRRVFFTPRGPGGHAHHPHR